MTATKMPLAVLWDMDGTLIDSEPYWHESELALAAAHDSDWTTDDSLSLIGKSLFDSSSIIKDRLASDLNQHEIIDRLTSHVVASLESEIVWRPGARELLQELRAAGIKTALVTMSMRRMALAVANSVGFKAFDLVVAGDDVTYGKPHPEPYLKAAEKLGVEPVNCVALEDSPTGIKSAEAAGVVTIGVQNLVKLESTDRRRVLQTLDGFRLEHLHELFKELS